MLRYLSPNHRHLEIVSTEDRHMSCLHDGSGKESKIREQLAYGVSFKPPDIGELFAGMSCRHCSQISYAD